MGKTNRSRTVFKLLVFLRPHWRTVALGMTALISYTLLDLIPPLGYRYIVDHLLPKSSRIQPHALIGSIVRYLNPHAGADQQRLLALFTVIVGLLLLVVASVLLKKMQSMTMHILGERFILDMRRRMYAHLQKMSLTFYETRRTGEVMSRVTNDSEVVEEFVTHVADSLVQDPLKVILIAIILFRMCQNLALVTFIPIPVLAFITYKYGRRVRGVYRSTRERLADMNAKLQDNLSGIRVIKSFAQEDHEYKRFEVEAEEVYDMRVGVIRLFTTFSQVTNVAGTVAILMVWGYGGYMVICHPTLLSLGTLIAFIAYISSFYQPVSNIARVNDTIQRALAAADRIFEVLDTEPDLDDAPNAIEMPSIKGSVTFDDVHFSYATGEKVLSGIKIQAEPGQIVALVGKSGAGKTSIVNLIPRFYDPIEGSILVDGIDVRTVKQQSLRSQIGIVLQDTFLFNGTIRDNILYGRLAATEDEMIEAAKAAHAHDFIMDMSDGYDTEIGERGVKLSGGQKQQMAIARAILADPRILILDEATSAVDSESEYLIHRAMDRMMQGRTTFVIAHRLSTIKHADIIITLEDGRIVEVGNHKTLIEKEGAYSQMYAAQYRLDAELS